MTQLETKTLEEVRQLAEKLRSDLYRLAIETRHSKIQVADIEKLVTDYSGQVQKIHSWVDAILTSSPSK